MNSRSQVVELVNATVEEAVARGIAQLDVEDDRLDGRSIRLDGREVVNFASCSYLGLELDPRVRRAAVEATERFGTQFSASRSYVSAPLYAELEALLDRIFDAHTLVTPNTTLAHIAALPILVEPGDAAILDHQVHQTVQLATAQLRMQGSHVEVVRHGRLDQLEERIKALSHSHRRVWYLADGVYSMYGEFAPTRAIAWLLERYGRLHVYLDDAHGMTWTGRHGRGFVADALGGQERTVIAVSLNKAFAAGGGALVFADPRLQRKVRNVGAPLMFTGPLQPPILGAGIASARIHLSSEITSLQQRLLERIRLVNRTARELDLPLASRCEVPIRFVGLGVHAACLDMTERLLARGFFTNPAGFPAVGSRNAGVRFAVNLHQTETDLRGLLEAVAEELDGVLSRAGTTRAEVDRAFGLSPSAGPRSAPSPALRCSHADTIRALDGREWDTRMAGRGVFDAATLAALEEVFGADPRPEGRWRFHYYTVRDARGDLVLATFFTESLWKDDVLAAARVSQEVERRREGDPYFLTSRVLAMGSLLTEGEHLYLDRTSDWRSGLRLLLSHVNEARDSCGAPALVLRDLPSADAELRDALADAGFFGVELPPSLEIPIDWRGREEFMARRSKRERRFHRERVEPFGDAWELEILAPGGRPVRADEWHQLHGLYRNVHGRQLALNTFPLPEALLPRLAETPGWELLLLRRRGEGATAPIRGFVACHDAGGSYAPLLIGMDYDYVESLGLYRQLLAHTVHRAEARGMRKIAFGMGSELEKRRFGARQVARHMYVQSHDRFHHDVLELIAADARLAGGLAG